MTPKALDQALRSLLEGPSGDATLRAELERLAEAEISFSGFTWLWGPELYRRNRVFFRPFILSRFASYMTLPKWKVEAVAWKGAVAEILDAWLAEVDALDDIELFRKLYNWKLSSVYGWRLRDKRSEEVRKDLVARFRSAPGPVERRTVLRKFDLWLRLDEESACALYACDPRAAGPYIFPRLPAAWMGGGKSRKLWRKLLELADVNGDEGFRWKLYRRQVPLDDWKKDCLELCARVFDSAELVAELEKRHPEGWGLNLADGFFEIVKSRGRDVLPYVMPRLRQVWGGWLARGDYGKMTDYARERGWWDLWAALIRVCSRKKEFNDVVAGLLNDEALPEEEARGRLSAIAGVSGEWNWPGLGLATVHQLDDRTAILLYERFPEMLRGSFKMHVQPHVWGEVYSKLLDRLIADGDEEMIDFIASRVITSSGGMGKAGKMLKEADRLADYYGAMKREETGFARRAANVLGQVPAYSIWCYNRLVRENRLARLLFERSAASFLADPRAVADLVEAGEIHVMALAYRALGLDDDRAREQAASHLPLLLGTLLRPIQRGTRSLAFSALANAAGSPDNARVVLDRARDALVLPDKRYPKEKLFGLIARVIHRHPELRAPEEQPVVFERPARGGARNGGAA